MKRTPTISILRWEFAEVEVARELEKLLTPDEAILQLVSRDNFVLVTAMLHESAASYRLLIYRCKNLPGPVTNYDFISS